MRACLPKVHSSQFFTATTKTRSLAPLTKIFFRLSTVIVRQYGTILRLVVLILSLVRRELPHIWPWRCMGRRWVYPSVSAPHAPTSLLVGAAPTINKFHEEKLPSGSEDISLYKYLTEDLNPPCDLDLEDSNLARDDALLILLLLSTIQNVVAKVHKFRICKIFFVFVFDPTLWPWPWR